eukprot:gene12355-16569_t
MLKLTTKLSAIANEPWYLDYGDGIITSNVKLANFDGKLRGIKSTQPIDSKTIITSVPAKYTIEVVNNRPPTPFPSFVSQNVWEKSLWYNRLAFKLLFEAIIDTKSSKEKAFWFSQLPQSFSTLIHWEDIVLSELQYSSIIFKVDQQSKDWKYFYDEWQSLSLSTVGNMALQIDYEKFVWAMECANSRAFSGTYEGSSSQERSSLLIFTGILSLAWPLLHLGTFEQSLSASLVVGLSIFARDVLLSKVGGLKRYVMCPIIDMFNHNSAKSSDVSYNYFSNTFELTTESYDKEEQIFVNYGKQSNDRFLQYYGFTEVDNPNDLYDFGVGVIELLLRFGNVVSLNNSLPTDPSPEDRLRKISIALKNTMIDEATFSGLKLSSSKTANNNDITTRYFRKSTKSDNVNDSFSNFDDITIRVLRALYSATDEWNSFFDNENRLTLEALGKQLSSNTELCIKRALLNIINAELASKPTTLDDDKQLLSNILNKKTASNSTPNSNSTKGFAKVNNVVSDEIDPSGIYSNTLISAIIFRIEKKKLLVEAIKSLS